MIPEIKQLRINLQQQRWETYFIFANPEKNPLKPEVCLRRIYK